MNEKKEYITITELAELLGVSRQSIYQRLNTSLKPYLKVINGIKCIEKSAINDVYGKEFLQDIEQDIKQEYSTTSDRDTLIEELQKQILFLQNQNNELIRLLDQQQQLVLSEHVTQIEQTRYRTKHNSIFKRIFGTKRKKSPH